MSNTANNVETLNGNFKKVYAEKLNKIIPSSVKILPEIDFIPSEKMGGLNYNVPIVLANEHGVTYGGDEGDAFTLEAPIAGTVKQATVKGNEIVLRSFLSYGAASRAQKSEGAFVRNTKHLVENMVESITKKLEAECLYGQVGLGKVDSVASNTVTMQTAEWASGIWVGSEKMKIDFYNGTTKLGTAQITSVDLNARQLTFDNLPAGVANGHDLYEATAFGKEFAGIHKILTNTGTLFEIDAATYDLWKSTNFSVGGQLSFDKISEGIAKAAGKGLDEDIKLYVSPPTWSTLISDVAAFRQYDQSYRVSEAEAGHQSIKFYSQNGSIEVIPHTYVKEGFAYGLVLDEFEKVGSTDVTFKIPDKGEDFFRPLENAAGFELRCYADWALFCHKPNKQILYTGITN